MKDPIKMIQDKGVLKWVITLLTIISAIITIIAFSETAVIIGGIVLLCIVFLYILIYFLVTKYYKNRKIFSDRTLATPSMIKDLKKYKHLAFIGVSHKQLHEFLVRAILENKEKTLPWESIVVFYATHELGNMWEEQNFDNNIKESKINIANVLFDENHKKSIPNLKSIQFRQCTSTHNFSSFSGCFCGNSEDNLQVIYSTNHLPIDSQTDNSWTIRLEQKDKLKQDPLFKKFEDSFIRIKHNAETICDIEFSLWEWSAKEWNDFTKKYAGFKNGVDKMLGVLDMNDKHILDIGSSTGNVADYIIKKFPRANFTLVDASANMLRVAKNSIGDKATYELFRFPLHRDYFIKNNNNRYDCIISHLSIQSVINDIDELPSFVSNCDKLLKSSGYVILAIHNSYDIQLEQQKSKREDDKFRIDLTNEIRNKKLPLKESSHIHFKIEDFREKFKEHFKEIHFEDFELPFSMSDRERLWKIPAVLDSVVDVEQIGITKGKEMVQTVYNMNEKFLTPPRRMIVFHFEKS